MKRLLTSSAALLWGLQFAFLAPVLALLLVTLYDATPADVGWVLAVYHSGGFVAALVIPAWADHTGNYLRPLLISAVLTVALAGALWTVTTLPLAVVALTVLGGPAGVGVSLLFAELRRSGADIAEVMNTRAIVSFAWVAGPPLATFIMGALGDAAILPVIGVVGALNVLTTALMIRRRTGATAVQKSADADDHTPLRLSAVVAIVVAFVLLQATNSVVMTIMTLFVTAQLGLPLIWGGITLAVAALVEVPALWLMGRSGRRFSTSALMISGCVAGVLYYVALVFLRDPATLLAAQLLNAWFFAAIAGIGMTLFQQIIPRPGLATGLFMNTRRIGAILSGPIIAVAGIESLGYPGVFALCAALTGVALAVFLLARRAGRATR